MGGNSSSSEQTYTRVVSNDKRETTVGFSAIPVGAMLEGERVQVPCPDGHHALRDGGDVLIMNLDIASTQKVVFCQTCLGHFFAGDQICNHFCATESCQEFAKTQPGSERFHCFLGPHHHGPHVCANCPTKNGYVGAGVTAEAKMASHKAYAEYLKAKYTGGDGAYIPTDLSQERFARPCVPMAMSRIPDGMMCQVTKVGRLTEFNSTTTTSSTVRTKESTFHSSMSIDSFSHTRSSYLEYAESRRVVATMHGGAPMLGPGQGAVHKQLTDTVQGQVANNVQQSEVVIKQKKSFLHENWSQFRRCMDGTHFGAVMFDAACSGRAYHERHFVDGSLTGQAQARLIVRTPIVCCIACGVTTTLLYQPDPSKFGRNWQWNKVSAGISRGMKCDWVPTIENIVTDAEAARSPNKLLGSILTMGTAPGRLYTDEQVKTLFPRHSPSSCDRGDHVFGVCTYSTRSQSRVQTVLESRQEFHSYSKSSSFSIGAVSYGSVRGSTRQSGFTRFSAICSAGSLTVAVHKCLFCNASKADPTDELELIATENAQDLIIRLLPPGFDIQEGFTSPVVMNLARECSMGSLSAQPGGVRHQPSGTSVGGGIAPAEKATDLPTLIEFLDEIPTTAITSADKLAIFAALHGEGYFLALLARMPELAVLKLGESVPAVRDEAWFEFVRRVAALGYCGEAEDEE